MHKPDAAGVYSAEGYGSEILSNIDAFTRYNRYLAGKIIPFLGETNVELGAGIGTISRLIPPRNKLVLTDVSPHNIERLRASFADRPAVEVFQGDVADYLAAAGGKVDAVYSSNVLEHIEDDTDLLRRVFAHLSPGARFVNLVPAMPSLYSRVDAQLGHFRRYGRRRARALAAGVPGAELEVCCYINPVGAVGWFIAYQVLRRPIISEGDARLMDYVIACTGWLDRLRPPIGQTLLFVLRKAAAGPGR